MKTLCVEGWRFIHHSYAMVNQWQLLSLLKRNDIALSVRDLPFFNEQWRSTRRAEASRCSFDSEGGGRAVRIETIFVAGARNTFARAQVSRRCENSL